jgi:riboflavin biosynthesis pyrimidine reductase
VRYLDPEHCPPSETLVAEHTALSEQLPSDRAFVRLNMISSADGGSAVAGLSGGLGNRDDHAVYGALRASADCVIVGLGTAIAEKYHAPPDGELQIYVIGDTADVSGNAELFESGAATLVLPESVGPVADGIPELRAGTGSTVDMEQVMSVLAGQVVVAEGGPTLAGVMASLGCIDEFFLTISPRVVAGPSARVVHGPEADPGVWKLAHGFADDEGFLFLRYSRLVVASPSAG